MDTFQLVGLSAATAIGMFLFFVGILATMQQRQASVERLRTFVEPSRPAEQAGGPVGIIADLDRWLEHQSFGSSIARNLAQADLKLTVSEYVLLHLGLAAMGLLVGAIMFGALVPSLAMAGVALFLPKLYVSSAQRKRLQAFGEQLPAALDSLSNSLRGGYGLVQAMSLVANEMPPPLSVEFQRLVTEVSYGLPYDVAFQNMVRRNPSPDLNMIVTAIEINLEVGGNLSEILDNISAIIRDRVRIQGQIKAYTAQTRASSMLLTAMPFIVAALLFVMNRSYISLLWTTPIGLAMLAVAGVMLAIGSMMLRKLSTIDV